jgi:hypothetical protein
MTFEEAALLPRSEKVSLVVMLAEQRAKLFTPYDIPNGIYVRDVDYFVESVKEFGFELEKVNTIAEIVTNETYCFIPEERKVYVRTAGGLDPKESNVSIVYRFHFSSAPLILPYDLNNGYEVEWLPYIDAIGSIGQQLDDQLTGVVLESSSSVKLQNNEGFFDPIFDKMIWENKEVTFYSWITSTHITEARRIFTGIVESKEFAPDFISFRVMDFIFKLRDFVNNGVFSEVDGDVLDSFIGKAKRRIYGRVDKCQTIPIDTVKDGFNLTGTLSITALTLTLNGSSTLFLKELSVGDEIIFIINDEEVKFTINSVTSDILATVSSDYDSTITSLPARCSPAIPYRFKNRRWHIAGHKLRQSTAEITAVVSARQFIVDDVSEFFADDFVIIPRPGLSDITTQITRVTDESIVLEQTISPIPLVGIVIQKVPVLRARFGNSRMILNRDFTITNTSEAILELDPLAEFNIATERLTSFMLTFDNGSSEVTSTSASDLRTIIKPRDWIRKLTQSLDVWFEVVDVQNNSIKLREPFSQTSGTEVARIKNVEIINDDSLITVDCYGMDYENKWVRTASNAVRHLVINDAGFNLINEESFTQADSDCKHTMSMVTPDIGENAVSIREVINKINDSVFGSLYGDSTQRVSYSIINSRRPVNIQPIKDDDILSWSSNSNNDIVNKVIVNYSPYIDTITGQDAFNVETFDSKFVNDYSKIKTTDEYTSYVYDQKTARIMAQRRAFYKSTSSLIITLKAKALFFAYSVSDRIYIEFDRLFNRYGSSTKKKIGIVSGVKKNSTESEITLNDMGNIFNRNPTIAPTSTPSFTSASEDEKIKYGFILSPTTETPDESSEDELGNCLIG